MAMKPIKLDVGTVYKKTENGGYYFRYQVNGQRKAVSLKTKNQKEAVAKAQELIPLIKASSAEVISAHVKHAKGLALKKRRLLLSDAWEVYSQHPDRATPAIHERESYRTTFNEFIRVINGESMEIASVTPELAERFAQYMRDQLNSVNTHNRKLQRIRRIFQTLREYYDGDNPFAAKSLRRKEREESGNGVRRMSFSREQEEELLKALDDSRHKVKNKPEIRIVYHLGMFTGQRMKDCVLLTWDQVDLKRKRIWVKQFKTGKEVTIPIAPKLMAALRDAQAWKRDNYVCPNVAARYKTVDAKGKNTGNNLVNIDVLRVIKWIGLVPSVEVEGRKKKVTVYGFHSLRHSFASHCAEAGVPKAVVLSILGTDSKVVDKYYTHIGEEAQEKAIKAIAGDYDTASDREKIDKALAYIDALDEKNEAMLNIEKILRGA